MGTALTERAKLMGLFGLDLVLDDQRVWLIEINPRYTASVELLEWTQGRSLLALHRAIFDRTGAAIIPSWDPLPGILGKAILRAGEDGMFPARLSERRLANAARCFPTIADVPDPRAKVRRGEPIMTVYARGQTARECRERLQGRIGRWTKRLKGS
jgi:predicted ATP-grasp superfamily ATP-dependent carboligase